MILNINEITDEEFKELPLVTMGESKEIRRLEFTIDNKPLCLIKLKPTVYSFTANRCGVLEGSDKLRLRTTKVFTDLLKDCGLHHSYLQVGDNYILSYLIEGNHKIETIVKAYHSGTSKHRYFEMDNCPTRKEHPWASGYSFNKEDAYPHPIVRFDWRNPMYHPQTNARLADEALPEDIADWYIDTKKAKKTALSAFKVISEFLSDRDILLYDICFFIAEDGRTIYGEVSQDCGRFRHFDLGSLDKDVWRSGKPPEDVYKQWELLAEAVEK